MAGAFGYELNPALLSDEEKQQIKEQVLTYKKYEMLINEGTYWRLSDPFKDEIAAWMWVSEANSCTGKCGASYGRGKSGSCLCSPAWIKAGCRLSGRTKRKTVFWCSAYACRNSASTIYPGI